MKLCDSSCEDKCWKEVQYMNVREKRVSKERNGVLLWAIIMDAWKEREKGS